MHWRKIFLIVFLLGTSVCPPLFAAPPSRVRSLTGVDAVQVAVEDLNHTTRQTGLRKEQIQDFAEQYLLKQGMKVMRGIKGMPIVYVRLSSVIGGMGAHAPVSFYLTVQVKQLSRLVHGREETSSELTPLESPLLVTTWEDGTMVMLDRKELSFYVQQVLSNLLGALVQDYQEANGKEGDS